MGETSSGVHQPVRRPEDRLDSWKEIAAYLNRDVTTVQRWEKREGMPVHRHLHDRMGSVYAFRAELDAWSRTRNISAARENGNAAPSSVLSSDPALSLSRSRWGLVWAAALVMVVLIIGLVLWLDRAEYFWRNPLANARFESITDFGGIEQAAAISRDGHFVAFLSDRDGPTGRLGHASRLGPVSQPYAWQCRRRGQL